MAELASLAYDFETLQKFEDGGYIRISEPGGRDCIRLLHTYVVMYSTYGYDNSSLLCTPVTLHMIHMYSVSYL